MALPETKLLNWAAGLSILAGIAHGALVQEHLEESIAIGAFFVLAALAQGMFGFVVLASHLMNGAPILATWPRQALRGWLLAGVAGNALLVVIYVLSRTVGFFGKYEAWSAGGVFVKAVELAIVVLLTVMVLRTRGPSGVQDVSHGGTEVTEPSRRRP